MGMEIERKYLLLNNDWRTLGAPVHYAQGYLVADGERTVRVRVAGTEGFLTIKGKSVGATRLEFEYEIPLLEAKELLDNFAVSELSKIRYKISYVICIQYRKLGQA